MSGTGKENYWGLPVTDVDEGEEQWPFFLGLLILSFWWRQLAQFPTVFFKPPKFGFVPLLQSPSEFTFAALYTP
jgi:hypothetical protein